MRTGIMTHSDQLKVPIQIRRRAWSALYSKFSCAARGEEERLMLGQHGENGRMVYAGTCLRENRSACPGEVTGRHGGERDILYKGKDERHDGT